VKSFFTFFFLLSGLFLIIDILQKKVITSVSWGRKATHVGSGLIIIFFPSYLTVSQIVLISSIFTFILFISRLKGILGLHQVTRKSWGEIIYPVSIITLALICLPNNLHAFYVGVLCLALSDFAAELAGSIIPIKLIHIGKHQKSICGFLGFFIVTIAVFSCFLIPLEVNFLYIFICAFILSLIELFSFYGSDNFTVPVSAAFMTICLL
jgi:phytol kinase